MALAGGVNIMVGPNTAIAESKSGFLSPEGRSKAFDDSADGYARGEGGAVVVIKPLRQALRDGDEIYAQILGTAVSQDGHTDGITVPREEAQEAAITDRSATGRASTRPRSATSKRTAPERRSATPSRCGHSPAHSRQTARPSGPC